MKWIRANIRHGSRLALFALAIQLALSFGHFHAIAAGAAGSGQSPVQLTANAARAASTLAVATSRSEGTLPASGHDSGGQPDDPCAICAVMAMANTVLFATPPLLQLPQAPVLFLYRTTDTAFADLDALRVAFQPRAPPIS